MTHRALIEALPKAELHLHIEGTLEPELMLSLAEKHGISLPYTNLQQIRQAYQFDDLQSFLDLYYQGAEVLRDEDDFFELMWQYLLNCKADNIVHTEIMFDPQTHTQRGIPFDVFMPGFLKAIDRARDEWGQSTKLIMSFLRDMSQEDAFHTLEASTPFLAHIDAVGLDSAEVGNPPEKFESVFAKAKSLGLKCVAHAGEEGPASYIWSAIHDLNVVRIDHGVKAIEDDSLIRFLHEQQIPLTVCPFSNVKLKVFEDLRQHNVLTLLDKGLCVTINSDDPSYFGGYLNDNFHAMDEQLNTTAQQIVQMVSNSFNASFLSADAKQYWLEEVAKVAAEFND